MKNYTVLLIDDDLSIHESVKTLFKYEIQGEDIQVDSFFGDDTTVEEDSIPFRIELISAFQGAEGVELYKKLQSENKKIDLVLCDIRMPPGQDGKVTIEELYKLEAKLIALVCSAYSDHSLDEIKATIPHKAMITWLEKPFIPAEAREIISVYLEMND